MAEQNMVMKVQGNKLIIEVDLSKKQGLSKSLKNTIIATTGGNIEVPGKPNIKIGMNVYTKAD